MNELALAAITCYHLGQSITTCDNGTTVYNLGNNVQIIEPASPARSTPLQPLLQQPTMPAIQPIPSVPSLRTLKPFDQMISANKHHYRKDNTKNDFGRFAHSGQFLQFLQFFSCQSIASVNDLERFVIVHGNFSLVITAIALAIPTPS